MGKNQFETKNIDAIKSLLPLIMNQTAILSTILDIVAKQNEVKETDLNIMLERNMELAKSLLIEVN